MKTTTASLKYLVEMLLARGHIAAAVLTKLNYVVKLINARCSVAAHFNFALDEFPVHVFLSTGI